MMLRSVENYLERNKKSSVLMILCCLILNFQHSHPKVKAEKLGKPLKTAITVLEAQVKAFVESSRGDMSGKSKDLNFGTVGFRQATSITYSSAKTAEIINKLKEYNMHNCINVKESVNKDVLKLYSDKEIEKIGAKRKTTDSFYYETDREKIKG